MMSLPLGTGSPPRCRCRLHPTWLKPQSKRSGERVRVVAEPRTWRQFFQFQSIAAAEHYVIHLECRAQPLRDIEHCVLPLLTPKLREPRLAQIVLVRASLLVRQM